MDWKDTLLQLKVSVDIPEAVAESAAEAAEGRPAHKGKLHISVEKKGRGGKTATIVYGFTGSDEELQMLGRTLRQRLGTGGSARGGEILLQGDRRDDTAAILRELGYKA